MCCKDLWYLEVTKPLYAVKVALVRASTHALELSWTATTFAAAYVLQIQKIETAQVTATKLSQIPAQQSVATDSNDTESAKSQISVIHLGAQTGVQSVSGVTKAAIEQTTVQSVQLPNPVKTVVSHTVSALATSTASTVQVQPQISIISSTATGATGGLLQKLRGSASSNKIATGSTVLSAAAGTEPTLAVRVATSVAPSGSIVLNPQTTASSTPTSSLRIVPSITSGTTGHGAGQTLRLAATYSNSPSNASSSGSTSTTTTILKTAQSSTTVQKSGSTTAAAGGATGTTSTLGGKQYFIQKPLTLAPNVQLQFVKTTSGGMAVQTLPKVNFNLAKGSGTGQAISVSNQQLSQGSTQIQVRQVGRDGFIHIKTLNAKIILFSHRFPPAAKVL